MEYNTSTGVDMRPPIPADVPHELKVHPNFVLWKYERRDGELTKVPLTAGNYRASHSHPDTWTTYDKAIHLAKANGRGIGFVFSVDDPYCGIDLDDCRNLRTGSIHGWAKQIIEGCGSYTEVSPSGTGVKIIVRATLGKGRKLTDFHGGAIEMYDRNRFFTLTGDVLEGYEAVQDAQEAVDQLLGMMPPPAPEADSEALGAPTGVQDPVGLLSSFRNGDDFQRLHNGNHDFESGSEADYALANKLAWVMGNDPEGIERVMRNSGLYREKWDTHAAYLQNFTILKAIANQEGNFYAPSRGRITGSWDRSRNHTSDNGEEMGGWVDMTSDEVPPKPPHLVGGLLVQGQRHIIHAKPEVGKTNLAYYAVGSVLDAGGTAVVLDLEMGEGEGLRRMLDMQIHNRHNLHFNPSPELLPSAHSVENYLRAIKRRKPDLVVFDSFANFLVQAGMDEASPVDVTRWFDTFIRPLWEDGITTLVLDHEPHTESRPRNSGAKIAMVDVMWGAVKTATYSDTQVGEITTTVTKDRHSALKSRKVRYTVGGSPFKFEPHIIGGVALVNDSTKNAVEAIRRCGKDGATYTEWKTETAKLGTKTTAFKEARKELLDGDSVIDVGGLYIWHEFYTGSDLETAHSDPPTQQYLGGSVHPGSFKDRVTDPNTDLDYEEAWEQIVSL